MAMKPKAMKRGGTAKMMRGGMAKPGMPMAKPSMPMAMKRGGKAAKPTPMKRGGKAKKK